MLKHKKYKSEKEKQEFQTLNKELESENAIQKLALSNMKHIKEIASHLCGFKKSSYFDNSKTFGPGESVHENSLHSWRKRE
jgi:hypothetical protein